jgi:hypothetical protein
MLGDAIHNALALVGVTPEVVSKWLGKPCGCEDRQAKLNALAAWSMRLLRGQTERAREWLDRIMGQ